MVTAMRRMSGSYQSALNCRRRPLFRSPEIIQATCTTPLMITLMARAYTPCRGWKRPPARAPVIMNKLRMIEEAARGPNRPSTFWMPPRMPVRQISTMKGRVTAVRPMISRVSGEWRYAKASTATTSSEAMQIAVRTIVSTPTSFPERSSTAESPSRV